MRKCRVAANRGVTNVEKANIVGIFMTGYIVLLSGMVLVLRNGGEI